MNFITVKQLLRQGISIQPVDFLGKTGNQTFLILKQTEGSGRSFRPKDGGDSLADQHHRDSDQEETGHLGQGFAAGLAQKTDNQGGVFLYPPKGFEAF
jgi:hypothetical protein